MLDEKTKEMLTIYNQGLELYRKREWDNAIAKFKEALEINPDDGPSKLYVERCQHAKEDPSLVSEDGVFEWKTK